MPNLYFTSEARTYILFPTDAQFTAFRDWVSHVYDKRMVQMVRHLVTKAGTTALIEHSAGLGAELRGLAHRGFGGSTVLPQEFSDISYVVNPDVKNYSEFPTLKADLQKYVTRKNQKGTE